MLPTADDEDRFSLIAPGCNLIGSDFLSPTLPFVRMQATVKNNEKLNSSGLLILVCALYVLFRKIDFRKQLGCFILYSDHAHFVGKI